MAISHDAVRPIEKQDYFREGLAPVRKPADWDVTIVYFMDYQCPACRQYTPDLARALKEDRRVRVIYRDTPLFGPRSDAAAAAAIAARFQGKHEAMHHALMTAKLPLDEAAIRAAADKAGVDWARLQRDLKERREDIDLLIAHNFELSLAAGIAGTPAFIIGDVLANGALEYKNLKGMIADARAASKDEAAEAPTSADSGRVKGEAHNPASNPVAEAASPLVFDKAATSVETDLSAESPAARSRSSSWLWFAGLAAAVVLLLVVVRRRRATRFDRHPPLA